MKFGGRLEEFVRESLVEIINGVIAAREVVKSSGAKVGFSTRQFVKLPNQTTPRPNEQFGLSEKVEFDLAVSSTVESTASANGKLQVWVVGLGASKDEEIKAEEVSRLKFAVPLQFPPPSDRS